MRRFAIAALAAALALPVLADPVEIKMGQKQGDKITRTTEFGGEGTLTIGKGEGAQELPCGMNDSEVVAEEVLEAKDGKPVKIKKYYTVNRNAFTIEAAGVNQVKRNSLVGHIVTVEMKDGKPVATCEAGTEKELKKEKMGEEIDEALIPGKPVNVGDTWEGDPAQVKKAFAPDDGEVEEASVTCKLEAVEEKFGQKCAKVTVKISMKATGKDDAGQKTKTKITLEGPVWFGLTAGRSLGMELEGKLVVNGSLPNGQPMKMEIDLKAKGESKPGVADFEAKAEEGDEEEGEGEEEEGGMK